jgi:hypothetical protein
MIKKIGNQYKVIAHSGRSMGTYNSKTSAVKRLKQIEIFKHMKGGKQ